MLKVISILSGLLNMTQQMQLNATVEGLETDDEIEIMTILGADYGQGYQIAKPMPADQVLPWLANMQWPYNPLKPKTHLGKLLLLQQRIDEACEKQRLENTGESCLLPAHDTTLSSIHSGAYQQLCQQLAQHNFLAARLSNYQLIETYVTQQRHAFDNAQTSLES